MRIALIFLVALLIGIFCGGSGTYVYQQHHQVAQQPQARQLRYRFDPVTQKIDLIEEKGDVAVWVNSKNQPVGGVIHYDVSPCAPGDQSGNPATLTNGTCHVTATEGSYIYTCVDGSCPDPHTPVGSQTGSGTGPTVLTGNMKPCAIGTYQGIQLAIDGAAAASADVANRSCIVWNETQNVVDYISDVSAILPGSQQPILACIEESPLPIVTKFSMFLPYFSTNPCHLVNLAPNTVVSYTIHLLNSTTTNKGSFVIAPQTVTGVNSPPVR